jgi:hypothetical protein
MEKIEGKFLDLEKKIEKSKASISASEERILDEMEKTISDKNHLLSEKMDGDLRRVKREVRKDLEKIKEKNGVTE